MQSARYGSQGPRRPDASTPEAEAIAGATGGRSYGSRRGRRDQRSVAENRSRHGEQVTAKMATSTSWRHLLTTDRTVTIKIER